MLGTKIEELPNNKFHIEYTRDFTWSYNYWIKWEKAIYEYKKHWNDILIRCIEKEEWGEITWDDIPEDTYTEEYNYVVIKNWKIDKKSIKKHHREIEEEELKKICTRHIFSYEIWSEFYWWYDYKKIDKLKNFILNNK